MISRFATFIVVVIAITILIVALIELGRRGLGAARRRRSGVSALGWALLFLTSGRMPPPPPASQIELDISGKKDREGSRQVDDL